MFTKESFVPVAQIGMDGIPGYPDCYMPKYEDNFHGVLHVCICDGCEDAKPRLRELATHYAVSIKSYTNKKGKIRPISDLFPRKK